jgi:hypothetical protein
MTKTDVKGAKGFKNMNGLVAMLAWRGGAFRYRLERCLNTEQG